jgi:butyrate response factor 1
LEEKPKREKKQMNFSSRAEMIRYIENFRTNYKTELCKNWQETGECEFGKECAYAHGLQELKSKAS